MDTKFKKLSLDRPATYQIKVPGRLDENWMTWPSEMRIEVQSSGSDSPITLLIGKVDQAALQGLLRRLYSMGLPLISVTCMEYDQGEL